MKQKEITSGPAEKGIQAASAPACSTTYAITAQSLTGELKWIAAGRIATDESRSAADSLAVRSVPQDSATGTRSEEEASVEFSKYFFTMNKVIHCGESDY